MFEETYFYVAYPKSFIFRFMFATTDNEYCFLERIYCSLVKKN